MESIAVSCLVTYFNNKPPWTELKSYCITQWWTQLSGRKWEMWWRNALHAGHRIEQSRSHESWPGKLRCIFGQTQCFFPTKIIDGYRWIVGTNRQSAVMHVQERIVILLVASCFRNWRWAQRAKKHPGLRIYFFQLPGEHIPSASSALCLQITSPVLASLLGPKTITGEKVHMFINFGKL